MDDIERDVFAAEAETLRKAKSKLSSVPTDSSEWELEYRNLVLSYEKLLRTTRKISRISDIQGRTLKEKEQEIEIANENLRQMEGLRRQLIQDISHELGTPMTTVQGYVEALMDGVVQPDQRYFRMIHNRLLSMKRLISDLFHLATLRANQITFHLKDMPWRAWLEGVSYKYAPDAAPKGLRLIVDIPYAGSAAALLRIDPIRIDQVLANFVNNAAKFTPSGGEIRLRCEAIPAAEAKSRFGPHISQDAASVWEPVHAWFAAVQVADTGIGFREEELPYLFDRFFRGKQPKNSEVHGAGLGLAISKEIIRHHGGEIGAIGKPGEGSIFFFLLPLQQHNDQSGGAPYETTAACT